MILDHWLEQISKADVFRLEAMYLNSKAVSDAVEQISRKALAVHAQIDDYSSAEKLLYHILQHSIEGPETENEDD